MDQWVLLQLSDSALPVGGFVASGGLESALQILNIKDVERFLEDSLHTLAYSSIPLIRSVYSTMNDAQGSMDIVGEIMELDKEYDAFVRTNHVNRRASVTQGVAYLTLISKSFPDSKLIDFVVDYKMQVRKLATPGHLPLCFALACISLEIKCEDAEFMFLFLHVRSIVSSAVRMSMVGPYEGQSLIFKAQERVREALQAVKGQTMRDIYQTHPIIDILQGSHDRLYTRIFNS
jgi:urease accessory protein